MASGLGITSRKESSPLRHIQIEVNGVPFHVVELGEGPAVLFCHGFPDTAATWTEQLRAVAAAGYRAIALDMRGYGASYAPDAAELYSALHTVGDLVGIIDELGIESAVLVGHDWGADVAQRAMLLRPDRFHALISLSIPIAPRRRASFYGSLLDQGLGGRFYAFDLMKPGAEALFAHSEKSIHSILYWLSGTPAPGTEWDPVDPTKHMLRKSPIGLPEWAAPEYVQHNVGAFARTGFRGGLNYYRAAQATFDLMPAFRDMLISQPSLYIWGEADGLCRFFHPSSPTLEEARIDAPGLVDVIRLDGVGHWIQHEASERLNEELLRFLARINLSDDTGSRNNG